MTFTRIFAASLVFGAATPAMAIDVITDWAATQGRPTDIAPPWAFSGAPANVTLANNILTIKGKTYYAQGTATTPGFDTKRAFAVEALARYVSGSTTTSTREGMNMFFTQGPNNGTALYIGGGHIFLASSNASNGATAFVDTTAAFHNYRLDVGAPGGNGLAVVRVYYDNILTLTGSTFTSSQFSGPDQRFDFGGGSSLASATSEWKYVRDYVPAAPGAVPEPATWALMIGGFGAVGLAARRRRQAIGAA